MNKLQITNYKQWTISKLQNINKILSFGHWFFWYCLLFVICGLLFGISSRSFSQNTSQVCFEDKCIDVEVVRREEELHRGLQFRKSLDPDSGMLFIFKESRPYAFWMKDTLIPLDMIWMDDTRKIVHVEHNVPPCAADPCPSYPPRHEALYVLEVNAGYAAALGLQLNDQAEFKIN